MTDDKTPSFQKRHLEYLAEVLAACRAHETTRSSVGGVECVDRVIDRFALLLEETNDRFKPEKFRQAAGRSTIT